MTAALINTLLLVLNIFTTIMIVYIIMTWLVQFQVLNLRQPFVAQVYFGLTRLLEPIFAPIRNILPQTGGIDFSPLVVFLLVYFLQEVLQGL